MKKNAVLFFIFIILISLYFLTRHDQSLSPANHEVIDFDFSKIEKIEMRNFTHGLRFWIDGEKWVVHEFQTELSKKLNQKFLEKKQQSADQKKLMGLFSELNQFSVGKPIATEVKDLSRYQINAFSTRLTLYDKNDRILLEVNFGKYSQDKQRVYTKLNAKNDIYLTKGLIKAYLMYPLAEWLEKVPQDVKEKDHSE